MATLVGWNIASEQRVVDKSFSVSEHIRKGVDQLRDLCIRTQILLVILANMSDPKEEYVTEYHYTGIDEAKKIKSSGQIKQSTGQSTKDDVTYGEGTYFTNKPPSHDRHSIAKNNYDGGPKYPKMKMDEGKLDAVVEVQIRKDKIEDHSANGRSVQRYPGSLDLNGPDVKSFKVYKNKSQK